MPPGGRASKRDLLYDLAVVHSGYFTTREAAEAGLTTRDLSYHRGTGRITPAFRGVYRLNNYPPGDHEEHTVVWLATDGEGVFSHETALRLHNLSDVLPNRIHVSVPSSWRRRLLPRGVIPCYVQHQITERQWIGDVPVTTITRTLADCAAAHVDTEFIVQAIKQAAHRGLLAPDVATKLADQYAPSHL